MDSRWRKNQAGQRGQEAQAAHEGPQEQQSSHVPVNNFNGAEVSRFLNDRWRTVNIRASDPAVPASERPTLHKLQEEGWSTTKSGGGGKSGHSMSRGQNILQELRKPAGTAKSGVS